MEPSNTNIVNIFTKKNVDEDSEMLDLTGGKVNFSPFNKDMDEEVVAARNKDATALSMKTLQSLFNMIDKNYPTNYDNMTVEEFMLVMESLKSLILNVWGIEHPFQEVAMEIMDIDEGYELDLKEFFGNNYEGVEK